MIDKAQDQAINAMGLYGTDLDAPENYELLQNISKLGQELEADSGFKDSFIVKLPNVDLSTLVAAGVVGTVVIVSGVALYKYNGAWVKASSISSGTIGVTKDIIAGYKGDVTHIINGSRSTTSGHAWEVLFNGTKPSFKEIEPYIASVIEKGTIKQIQNLTNGGKIVYKTLNIEGYEVWVKEFVQKGISRLSDAGVNNW